jgi:PEP-CTERM motif
MTQEECLASPHHFTHLGVCYPGNQAYLTLSNPNDPQPVKFTSTSVPEPSTAALFALALILCLLFARIRRRGGSKLG